MEQTVSQQSREVTQLHQTIDQMTRMLEAHTAGEEAQWLSMNEWLEDWESKWDERNKDNVLWGTSITDMTTEVLTSATVHKAAQDQKARTEG